MQPTSPPLLIRNLFRVQDALVAETPAGRVEVCEAVRSLYLAGDQTHIRGRGVHAVRDGSHTRLLVQGKRERYDEVLARLRAAGLTPLEADVGPVDRALAELNVEVAQDHRLLYIDLECADGADADMRQPGTMRVLSFAWSSCGAPARYERAEDESRGAERTLLAKLLRLMGEHDIVLAWNGGREWGDDGFDFPVIRARCKALDLEHDWFRQMALDQMQVFVKKFLVSSDGGERQSFSLDAVASSQLGKSKLPLLVRLREMGVERGESKAGVLAAYRHAPELLAEYNRNDVDLQVAIEAKTGFVAQHLSLCALVGALPRSDSLMPTRIMDALMLCRGHRSDHRWPTRSKTFDNPWEGRHVSGAAVMKVEPGLREGVSVLDVGSLYPSLIRALNLGPDTLDPEGPIRTTHATPEGKPLDAEIARFRGHDRPGQIPGALELLLDRRKQYERELRDHPPGTERHEDLRRLSNACKVAVNAFYGIILQAGSRFYHPDVGESVTSTGRILIREVVEHVERRGFRVVLQDTDSAGFVCGPEDAPRIRDEVNAEVFPRAMARLGVPADVARRLMVIKYEERYKRLLQVRTKGYAGVFEVYREAPAKLDSKPDVKGLECVKGDTCRVVRLLQRAVIERILGRAPDGTWTAPSASFAEVCEMVEAERQRFLARRVELEDVVVYQRLTKKVSEYKSKGPHVRAAERAIARGDVVGDKVAYWLARGADGPQPRLPDEWDPAEADLETYWEDRVLSALDGVLAAAYPGADLAMLRLRKRQQSLAIESPKRRKVAAGSQDPAAAADAPITVVVDVAGEGDSLRDRMVINRVAEVARLHPGTHPLVIVCRPTGQRYETELTSRLRVSAEAEPLLRAAARGPEAKVEQRTLF